MENGTIENSRKENGTIEKNDRGEIVRVLDGHMDGIHRREWMVIDR